jgi:16S rRNA (guanine527-N7)-methyltransferase
MDKLKQDLSNLLGLHLTSRQERAFLQFEKELLEWNAQFNLTAIRDSAGIRTKHFLDSLTCMLAWRDNPPGNLVDIGTGAGFPGIPLKIIMPSLQLTLVESVGKKARFCEHIVKTLGLTRVEVIHTRAEELGHLPAYREKFDWAVARAVATLPVLVEFLLPLVKVGGAALSQKGESAPVEAHGAEHACRLVGGHIQQLIPVELPGVAEQRYLVVIRKSAATPPAYPRRVGVPSKSPL